MKKIRILNVLDTLSRRFIEDEVPALGAQMAYYLLLSFFPFLVFFLALLSYTPIAEEQALRNFAQFLPDTVYIFIYTNIHEIISVRSGTLLSFGMIGTLWTASIGVNALIRGINKAYAENTKRPFWKTRTISLLATLAIALMIVLSLITLIFGEILGEHVFAFFGFSYAFQEIWDILRQIFPLSFLLIGFIFLYAATPKRHLPVKDVIPGSVFSTIVWFLISYGFSYYVNHFGSYNTMYGSIGGVIVLMLWLYLSSIIILLGGELNATLAFLREQ